MERVKTGAGNLKDLKILKGPVTSPALLTLEVPLLTLLSVAKGSMGVQYLPWVINEDCLEFTQFLSRNIDVRVVPDLRMQEM